MYTDLFSYFIDSSYSEHRWIEINRKYKGFEINQKETKKEKLENTRLWIEKEFWIRPRELQAI